VFIKIHGKTHYLWRAVDQDGTVLDILVTSRRNAKAATRFFRKLLPGLRSVPRVLITVTGRPNWGWLRCRLHHLGLGRASDAGPVADASEVG
jgi:transposase-like protein